jgi:hypothetical protein
MDSSSHQFTETSNAPIDDDLVSSAYSITSTELLGVSEKKLFRPWHLPRKHYCRLEQWARHTQKLQNELRISNPAQERPLRYLTLPGDELLDIRVLAKVMKNAGIRMQFLGFNTASDKLRSAESDLSFSEVRQLEGIHEKPSEIIQHRIEKIAEANSIARQKVVEHLPFDVINLDFTGSIVGHPPLSNASYLQAIRWLIDEQCNKNRKPWLLFLTVPLARDGRTNDVTASQLWSSVYQNAQKKDFAESLFGCLQIKKGEILGEMRGFSQLDDQRYSKGLALALNKWVLGLLISRSDKWTVKLVDTKSYRVHGNIPEMYSMSLKFIPHEIKSMDATGLTITLDSSADPLSELEVALELIQSIHQTEDVDKLLDGDRALLDEAITYTAELLATVRYNADEYKEWALKSMEERNLFNIS